VYLEKIHLLILNIGRGKKRPRSLRPTMQNMAPGVHHEEDGRVQRRSQGGKRTILKKTLRDVLSWVLQSPAGYGSRGKGKTLGSVRIRDDEKREGSLFKFVKTNQRR